jgi:multiple antibiotic resistance protein
MAEFLLYVGIFVTIFALVDPVGTLPFFVALTQGFDEADRAVIIRRSVTVAGTVLAIFALVGRFLFAAFGLTLAAFEIAGGILLFTVAYDMLHGEVTRTKLTPEDREEAIDRRDELSVVPLGIPLLAGPGAISTVMIFEGTDANDPFAVLTVFIAIGITIGATFFIFQYGQRIFRYLGKNGIMAMTRVLGLLLAAVGVQFVVNGILGAFGHL